MKKPLVILDRDGVINTLLGDDFVTDSPMNLSEIDIFPWIPSSIKQLTDNGFDLVIASNQPAWAKGKISLENLSKIHFNIVSLAQSAGGHILSSHICFHRSEDNCSCRKPKIGLFDEIFKLHKSHNKYNCWIVGDRATDIIAGNSFGLKTALIGRLAEKELAILSKKDILPSYFGISLQDFTSYLIREYNG